MSQIHLFSSQSVYELLNTFITRTKNQESNLVFVSNLAMQEWLEFEIAQTLGCSLGYEIQLSSYFLQFFQEQLESEAKQLKTIPSSYHLLFPILTLLKEQDDLRNAFTTKNIHKSQGSSQLIYLVQSLSQLIYEMSLYNVLPSNPKFEELPEGVKEIFIQICGEKNQQGRFCFHSQISQDLLERIAQESFSQKHLTFFLVSTLPGELFSFFRKVCSKVPIDVYFLSPSAHPWFYCEGKGAYGQELLSNWFLDSIDRLGRPFAQFLFDHALQTQEMYNVEFIPDGAIVDYVTFPFKEGDATVLKKLKADFLSMRVNLSFNSEIKELTQSSLFDNSVQFHLCSSKNEEVDCVIQALSNWLKENPQYSWKDVYVVAPEINSYRAAIHYFCHRYEIPYFFWEEPKEEFIAWNEALDQWTRFAWNGAKISDFQKSFQNIYGRDLFGFSKQDQDVFSELVDLGLKWGWDIEHRNRVLCEEVENFSSSSTVVGSWKWALDRLIQTQLFHERTSSNRRWSAQELQSSLVRFERLGSWVRAITSNEEKNIFEWINCLDEQLASSALKEDFFCLFRSELFKLVNEDNLSLKLSFKEFWELFKILCEKVSYKNSQSPGDALRFSSMNPMRSIPAQCIAIMGMNESSFPRSTKTLFTMKSFSPTMSTYDRYSFLELILSTQERLVISLSPNEDEDENQPSSVVYDLYRYIAQNLYSETEFLVQEKVTSSKNVEKKNRGIARFVNFKKSETPCVTNISFDELKQIAKRPIEAYFKHQFNCKVPSTFFDSHRYIDTRDRFRSSFWREKIEANSKLEQIEKYQAYLDPGKNGILDRVQKGKIEEELQWIDPTKNRESPSCYFFNYSQNLLYGHKSFKDLGHGNRAYPAIEVALAERGTFYVEGVLPMQMFYKAQLPIKNYRDLLQWWPSILAYCLCEDQRCFEGKDFSKQEQTFFLDLTKVDIHLAWKEWLTWTQDALVSPCPYLPIWLDKMKKGNFQAILDEFSQWKSAGSELSDYAFHDFLSGFSSEDFSQWLKVWEERFKKDFNSLLIAMGENHG